MAAAAARAAAPSPSLAARARSVDFEDVFSTRVLAWLGGIAVVLGIAFFVAVAIGRGWIDERTRIALAFAASLALLGAGVWLRERKGATQASLSAVGAATAGLYLTLTAAVQLYSLIPAGLGLGIAFAVGVLTTTLAVRWDARLIAGLGITGALTSPWLVEAEVGGPTMGFVLVALASATGVLVWRRWDWLALGAFVISAPQVVEYAGDTRSAVALMAGVGLAWALWATGALGHEVRVRGERLRPSSSLLLAGGALVAAAAGHFGLRELDRTGLADGWLAGLAVAHLALAVAALRSERVSRAIALQLGVQGIGLADLAFGLAAEGPALAVGWAATAALLARLPSLLKRGGELSAAERQVINLGLSAQLVLAIGHVWLFEAPPSAISEGPDDLVGASAALVAVIVSALLCARFVREPPVVGQLFDIAAMATLAYLTAVILDGAALCAALAAEAVALAEAARRFKDRIALGGMLAFLLAVALHVIALDAPPDALVHGLERFGEGVGALLALIAGAITCALAARAQLGDRATSLLAGGAIAIVYLVSVVIISAFQPDTGVVGAGLLELDVRQQGQVVLSAFWSLTGLGALIVGLVRDTRALRLGGLALLGLAIAKVFLYDLATLDSIYRVLSFIGLGLLLLAASFAYQRMRPRPPSQPPS